MSDYVKQAADAGDQYLAAIAEGQDHFLKALAPVNEWMTSAATATTAMPQNFAVELPTPHEIAEANFAFANKLLKQQKKFAEKFLAVATPA